MAEHRVSSGLPEDGEMVRLELEGKPVVITRVEGQYYAFGGNCPHYGAPLDKGVLKGHTLMCPWHHACFDVRTAVRLEPPAAQRSGAFPRDGWTGWDLSSRCQTTTSASRKARPIPLMDGIS